MSIKDGLLNSIFRINNDDDYDDDDFDEYDDDFDEEASQKVKFSFRTKDTSKYDDDDEDDSSSYAPSSRASRSISQQQPPVAPVAEQPQRKSRSSAKVVPFRGSSANTASGAYPSINLNEISMIKPKTEQDGKNAIDDLKAGKTLILNLDGLNSSLAQHVFDYVSGASYCMGCNFDVIATGVYVFSPINVELTGDFENNSRKNSSEDNSDKMRSSRYDY